ncbi:MAG: hypothetical protein DCC68_17460 [Planctomycetota bacterium]|nr:MAG: hypothetical protein DCC68_17460 [Planctomycetota bacterium]
MKFRQAPMIATPIPPVPGALTYFGHDELSTAYGSSIQGPYQGRFMADDFADRFDTPVVHLRWWGSYMGQEHIYGTGVKRFYIGFESDVPVGPDNPFSHPGTPLLEQFVTKGPLAPGSGTFTETLIRPPDPLIGEALYEYNAELTCPFPERPDTVYWLKVVALVNPQEDGAIEWGWHNRDYTVPNPLASTAPAVVPGEAIAGFLPTVPPTPVWHFQDDAVQGSIVTVFTAPCQANTDQFAMAPQNYVVELDGPPPIDEFSKDLAFELYTIPEPPTGILALVGTLIAWRCRARRA